MLSANAHSVLNHLAAMPKYGTATVEKNDLKAIMLQTGGWMLACGDTYDIHSKHLGGGVYRLSLKRSKFLWMSSSQSM